MKKVPAEYFNIPLKITTLILICIALLLLSRYVSCIEIPFGEKINVVSAGKGGFIDFYCVTNRTDVEARVTSYNETNGKYEFKLAISAAPGAEGSCLVKIYGVRPDGSVEELGEKTVVLKSARPGKPLKERIPRRILLRGPKPMGVPIFKVKGGRATRYLRNFVGVLYVYGNGYWEEELEEGTEYHSYVAEIPKYELNFSVIQDFIEIKNIEFPSLLLTSKYTSVIQVVEGTVLRIEYYPGTITANIHGSASRYTLIAYHYEIPEEVLRKSRAVAPDPKYLQVPEELADKLRSIASQLTVGCDNDYDKVKKLIEFLKSNYRYDEDVKTPITADPVEYFLFESRSGVCRHFNSALALLLRSIGIPARVVNGFIIPPGTGEREVTDREAHLWVEVYFEGIGWVSFDAAPSGPQSCMCESKGKNVPQAAGRGSTGKSKNLPEKGVGGQGEREEREILKIVFSPNPLILNPGEEAVALGKLLSDYDIAYINFRPRGDISVELVDVRGKSFKLKVKAHEFSGEYKVYVSAVDKMGRSGAGILRVIVIGGFKIVASPPSVEVIRGQSATINLSIIAEGYYPYKVTLGSSQMKGIETLVRPWSGKPPFNATLFVKVSKDVKPGVWWVIVTGRGEDGAKYEAHIQVKVKARTRIVVTSVNPKIVKKGGTIFVKGKLTTEQEEPLSDKKVEVFLSINKSLDKAIKIGSAETLEDGTFEANCTIPITLKVGNYEVIAVFRGDEFYLNSTSDPTVKIISELVITAEIPSITLMEKTYEINGKVQDIDGTGVEGVDIVVYLNDTRVQELTSKARGELRFNLTFTKYGTWVIRLVHPGSNFYLESETKAVTRTLRVDLNFPSFFIRGVTSNVTGYIYGLKKNDFEAAGINMTVEARLKSYVVTNMSELLGPAFSIPLFFNGSAPLGSYRVDTWLKLGDNLLLVDSTAIPLKAATRLLVSAPQEVGLGENFTITVKLVDAYYENITIGGVTVYVNGKPATLNSTGITTVTCSVPSDYENAVSYTHLTLPTTERV